MWINEAQIELIAMTSHNSGAAKWEYVVGPPESQRLFRFQGDARSEEDKAAALSWITPLVLSWQQISFRLLFYLKERKKSNVKSIA